MTTTNDSSDISMTPDSSRNPFQLLQNFHTGTLDPSLDVDDDATIAAGSLIQTRLTLRVPVNEEASSKATQILAATKEILECLKNEFPSIQIIPWKVVTLNAATPKRILLPTDPKEAEAYVFNYTRFFSQKSG